MDSMKRNGKHFTNKDREVLKFILIEFVHIVESKRTDASKMKSSAWEAITQRFNESSGISEARTAKQLRTLWNNMKAAQRNALTKEKVMGTGGGPPPSPAEVDPEVAEKVPHLMATAPCLIDSNMTAEEMDAVRVNVLMEEEGDAMADTFNVSDIAEIVLEELPSGKTPLPSTSFEREPKKLCRNRISSTSSALHEKRYNHLLQLDLERSRRLKEQDEVLFEIKKRDEEQKLFQEQIYNLKKQVLEEKLKLAKKKTIEFETVL